MQPVLSNSDESHDTRAETAASNPMTFCRLAVRTVHSIAENL
jgi:hypothetical protein